MVVSGLKPTFCEEIELEARGLNLIAGMDEAGRGSLAGPVVAAAVILPHHVQGKWVDMVRDSKLLTPNRRDYLYDCIREVAVSTGVGVVASQMIDTINILQATRMAMKEAVEQMLPQPEWLLIDHLRLPEIPLPQKSITNGDALCFSIACASIIAKVYRDRLMVDMDSRYDGYGFCRHKGYGTKEHLDCLRRLGPSPIHRRSFRPVRELC